VSGRRGKIVSQAEFKRMWESRATLADIGAVLGITPTGVSARARKRGLTPRKPGPRSTQVNIALFAKMWGYGVDRRDMAKFFGVALSTVYDIAKRQDLELSRVPSVVTIAQFENMTGPLRVAA
jgi:hypothetical protein